MDPYAVNNEGQVVGEAPGEPAAPHAFVWLPAPALGFPTAGLHDLGALGTNPDQTESGAHDISDAGRIVGWSHTDAAPQYRHPFLWDAGAMTDLGTLEIFHSNAEAWDVNDQAPFQIVGWSENNEYCQDLSAIRRAFRWDSNSEQMVDLGATLEMGEAFAVNTPLPGQSRIIGGRSSDCDVTFPGCDHQKRDEAVAWQAGGPVTLAQPAGFGDISGQARGVNRDGTLVGSAVNESNDCLDAALIWLSAGTTGVVLETVPPAASAKAEAINISDWVVGFNDTTDRAALWQPDGPSGWTYTELDDLISASCQWNLRVARDINDDNWIVGWGYHNGGHAGFLLTPIGDCPADLNEDGTIGILDLLALLAAWGNCQEAVICSADLDGNCTVDVLDLLRLLADWGPCPEGGGDVPQTVEDCLDKFCCEEDKMLALEKCLCAIALENCQ